MVLAFMNSKCKNVFKKYYTAQNQYNYLLGNLKEQNFPGQWFPRERALSPIYLLKVNKGSTFVILKKY